jgi:undecaprenyl pyrophosphate synthase
MMKMKSTTVDVKIAGAAAGKLVNASVRREVESALEAYRDADQLIINIARKYAGRVLMQ